METDHEIVGEYRDIDPYGHLDLRARDEESGHARDAVSGREGVLRHGCGEHRSKSIITRCIQVRVPLRLGYGTIIRDIRVRDSLRSRYNKIATTMRRSRNPPGCAIRCAWDANLRRDQAALLAAPEPHVIATSQKSDAMRVGGGGRRIGVQRVWHTSITILAQDLRVPCVRV